MKINWRTTTQAEAACRLADDLFDAGDIRGALRHAARRLCPSLPAAANAVAVYEIHAAAGARPGSNWRAVLGVARGAAATRDAVTRQFRRLSLRVHPDKNGRCAAAAEGAFKLLRQAFDDALKSSHQPEPDDDDEEEPHDSWKKQKFREEERQRKEERSRMKPVPVCPYTALLCPFCKREFVRMCRGLLENEGTECGHCFRWLNSPWQKKKKPTDPSTGQAELVFPCPADCPACGMRYMVIVSVGEWCLRCTACGKKALVNVQGPKLATATRTGRP
ncbi:hypothetical protein PR202_gb10324 [Eleusine coracana subsp. coracana]|uniref:J domain-containing protein n=1 Tax=Eleusine coracana subsp. coracana TaxID=191504 RepID=A0AAV5EJK8_ELECO|nr:hypothetical protein PR202_gb10324 [Eleusine coracana subsp. coracana]